MLVSAVIEKQKAEKLLSETNRIWPASRKIIKVELIYMPLYLFTIKLEDKKGQQFTEMVSVDGIKGEFAFFRETDYEQPANEPTNKFSWKLTESTARQIASGECQRFLLKNNLKNSNTTRIVVFSEGIRVFYPYWIGYLKRKNGYDFEVIDAVGGSKQGIKMRPVFIDLILQSSETTELIDQYK